jgi:WD40 repeat protein/energy-coupling factor transporter ATP-binding protein EcfA2
MAGIEHGTRWLQLDPMMEAAHRQMMLLLAYNGQHGAALKQYETCVRVLEKELGVEPAEETAALHEQIRTGSLPVPEDGLGLAPAEAAPVEPPFKGLQFFDVGDADLFFGREQLTAKLVGKLREQRFVAVVGASGSGKSSLVRAGLVPALTGEEPLADGTLPPAGSQRWPVHIITPTAHPLEALAASLTRDAESVTATATLIDDLGNDSRILNLYVRKLLSQNGSDRLLLLVDQFEELFTLCRDERERRDFVDNLLTAVADETAGPTMVVITLRADFYTHCAQYRVLRALLESHQVYIGQMNGDELRRAIEGPAHKEGYDFEPGLVDLLLRDIGAGEETEPEPGALPLLSHTLLETWKRRRDKTMTFEAYVDSGGVRGAIAQTAERVYHQQLTPEQQEIARNIFLRLTELGEGTQDTRRRAPLEELIPRPEDAADVEAVLRTLADARLVTMAEGTAEVAHEALIREWPQLREWLDEGREGLRLHRQLTEAAQGWLELERDTGALYRGARLAQASEWAEGRTSDLNPLEREFLEASQAWVHREEAEREAQRQRELALERRRAEEQARAAEQLRRRRRYLLGALAVASLLAVVAIFFGIQFRQSATEAEQQSRRALARELAARSVDALEGDPDLSLLLAIEAVNTTRLEDQFTTSEAEVALYRALTRSAFLGVMPDAGPREDQVFVNFNPEGTRIVTTSTFDDGNVNLWHLSGDLIAALEGHSSGVYSAQFNPEGTRIVTASSDGTARLWDAEGNLLATLRGNTRGRVWAADFSPDGKLIVVSGGDGTARLYNGDGMLIASLEGHTDSILSARFGPGGQWILTGSEDGTARLWDAATALETGGHGTFSVTLEGHTDWVQKGIFSPDGNRIVTSSNDGTARLWDVSAAIDTGSAEALIAVLEAHKCEERWERCASISPDGTQILTIGEVGKTRLWNADGELLTQLEGHTDWVTSVSFSPDGRQIVTASADGTARVWDREGNLITILAGHGDWVSSARFSPDGTRIATGSTDGTVRLWDAEGALITELTGHDDWVQTASYHPNGNQILTASVDGTAMLWDVSPDNNTRGVGRLQTTLEGHEGEIRSAAYGRDGSTILTASGDGTARLWSGDGDLLAVLEGHSRSVRWATFSPTGDLIVTASDDGTARLWGVDGDLRATLEGHLGSVQLASFSPDGAHVVTAGRDGAPRLWDVPRALSGGADDSLLAILTGHSGQIESVVFSPDGQRIVTAGRDYTARLWDLEGNMLGRLVGHGDWVRWAAFSPDGAQVVTASSDGTARLWDVSAIGQGSGVDTSVDGSLVATMGGHTDGVFWVGFSPDGRRIATTSEDGSARLWNAEGNFLAAFEGHTGPVVIASFSPDGTEMVTASQDGTARVWRVWKDAEVMLMQAMGRVSRSLTAAECQQYLHVDECPDRLMGEGVASQTGGE